MGYLFFSTEAEIPAGYFIVKILAPIAKKFNNLYDSKRYSDKIDSICIVAICTSLRLQNEGFYKERKYISYKKRYADIRLRLDYEKFLSSSDDERKAMCFNLVLEAIQIIQKKLPDFNGNLLSKDIASFWYDTVDTGDSSLSHDPKI